LALVTICSAADAERHVPSCKTSSN